MLGLRVTENINLVIADGEDWSRVRSPGRAARRRRKHRQNIIQKFKPDPTIYRAGDKLVMHPAIAAELRRQSTALEQDTRP